MTLPSGNPGRTFDALNRLTSRSAKGGNGLPLMSSPMTTITSAT